MAVANSLHLMSNSWQWHIQTDYSYLSTSLLDRWPHGFFTRRSWPQDPTMLSQYLDPQATVYRAKQVHGRRVIGPQEFSQHSRPDPQAPSPEADAVMTQTIQQAVWVCTADCTPALVGDTKTGQVAAVHAGWRGTALKIIPAVIARMVAAGSEHRNLRIAMGPAITGEVYQVTTQVATEVGRSLLREPMPDDALLEHLQGLNPPSVLPDDQPGRVRLDIRYVNRLQLLQLGIAPEHIAIAANCTYQEPDDFFSYRRTREKKVQWSGIVSN